MRLHIYQNNEIVTDKNILQARVSKSILSFPFYPFMILFSNKSWGDLEEKTEVR